MELICAPGVIVNFDRRCVKYFVLDRVVYTYSGHAILSFEVLLVLSPGPVGVDKPNWVTARCDGFLVVWISSSECACCTI